jgi:ribosome-binding protein aMBF1 (putative translation factor)
LLNRIVAWNVRKVLSPRCCWLNHRSINCEPKYVKVNGGLDMDARQLVAWNVRRIRVLRGISSETLAADSNVDRAYVSRIERAVANPTIDILERIAGVLEVNIAELFAIPKPHEKRPEPLPGGRRTSGRRGRSARS